jgi:hypothetical protein
LDSLTRLKVSGKLKKWSPETPHIYTLKTTLLRKKDTLHSVAQNIAFKTFEVQKKKFLLNGQPFTARAGSVVWHRWVRDSEGKALAHDTTWFVNHVILPLKERGANTLRFHLGTPPERILELCDRYGLLVQYEWLFFHGLDASQESLKKQWKDWLDLAVKHPSIGIVHPYNETDDKQLKIAWQVLNEIVPAYPPFALEDRDQLHVHKYWWSLFENVGVYYDTADQFPKAIMVDEFGGNYLDGNYDLGGYKTLKESYMRFLGKKHTVESRKYHHTISSARVAEYWRRIGAAGYSPFCILGSWDDGNHWYEGNLVNGKPKPIWNALTAAYSPVSVSLDIWDRNFFPAQQITVPLHFFNETDSERAVVARVQIINQFGKIFHERSVLQKMLPFSQGIEKLRLDLPLETGEYTLKAFLEQQPENVKYPVVSSWDFHIATAEVAPILRKKYIGIPQEDKELIAFAHQHHLQVVDITDRMADLLLIGTNSWKKVASGELTPLIQTAIESGKTVIIADAGERLLGEGYPKNNGDLGNLQGAPTIKKGEEMKQEIALFAGLKLLFTETAEPESHLHPSDSDSSLWKNIPFEHTWLWNGLRGGLIVPAVNMELTGLSPQSFINQWTIKGAETEKLKSDAYFAYELSGFYAFSDKNEDKAVQNALREKVKFLVDDAPALATAINQHAPITVTNLTKAYQESLNGKVEAFVPLAVCGKNLTRTPIVKIGFGAQQGKLFISQLITAGRLHTDFQEKTPYGIRYDITAVQMLLNLLEQGLSK